MAHQEPKLELIQELNEAAKATGKEFRMRDWEAEDAAEADSSAPAQSEGDLSPADNVLLFPDGHWPIPTTT